MVTVAIAGGSGTLGRTIVDALLEQEPRRHTVIVLSRFQQPRFARLGVLVRTVDYNSQSSLIEALRDVDTVLSTINTQSFNPSEYVNCHKALLEAAKAAGVRRFAPNEWGSSDASNRVIQYRSRKSTVWDLVKDSGLEYTAFRTGTFMNFLAHGSPSPGMLKKGSPFYHGLIDIRFIIDVAMGTADIPGTGDELVTLTTMGDAGRFTAAALDLDVWPEELGMAGSVTSFNQIVKEIENITGRKLKVTYMPATLIKECLVGATGMSKFLYESLLCMAIGIFYIEPNLNEIVDVEPETVQGFLQKWWCPG